MVLYEHQNSRPRSPPSGSKSREKHRRPIARPSESGYLDRPSTSFGVRVQPFLLGLHQQVIRTAIAEKHTDLAGIAGWNLRRGQCVAASITLAQNGRASGWSNWIRKSPRSKRRSKRTAIQVVAEASTGDETVETGVVLEAIAALRRPSQTFPHRRHRPPPAEPAVIKDQQGGLHGQEQSGEQAAAFAISKGPEILNEKNKTNSRRRKRQTQKVKSRFGLRSAIRWPRMDATKRRCFVHFTTCRQ